MGNKSDLEEFRQVPFEKGKSFAKLNNYIFMEVSCLENKNIEIKKIIRKLNKIEEEKILEYFDLKSK